MKLLLETSTKQDGNLAWNWGEEHEVRENRSRFLHKISVPEERCVFMDVNHGDVITRVDASHAGSMVSGEALITNTPNVFLFLLTADCFPVAFHDPVRNVIALAHMGWRPTDKLLAEKVVVALREKYSCRAEDLQVMLGPGIHKESYLFTDTIAQKESGKIERWRDFIIDLSTGETQVDVQGFILKQLRDAGVLEEHIQASAFDTASFPNTDGSFTYFSHYREVRTGEAEGRFATVIGLRT